MSDDRDEGFAYGEWVEFKLNTNVFGIVVGSDALGLKYLVQLSPSGFIQEFHGVTLQSMEDDDGYDPGDKERAPEGNVINFTEARALHAKSKVAGRA